MTNTEPPIDDEGEPIELISELETPFEGNFSPPPVGTILGDPDNEVISYGIFKDGTPDPIGALWVTPRGLGGFIPTESTGLKGVSRSWGWNRDLSRAQIASYENGETFDGLAWLNESLDEANPQVYQVEGPFTAKNYGDLYEMFAEL